MKQIVDFYLPKMSQQQAFLFFQKAYNLMIEISDARLQPLLKALHDAVKSYEHALRAVPNRQLAEKIAIENDNRFKAMEEIARQAADMAAEGMKQGEKINSVLSAYETIATADEKEKTALFDSMSVQLEREAGTKADPQLKDNISLLKRSNMAYKQYVNAYQIELTGRCVTSGTLRTRKETERIYETVVAFINAMLIYLGDSEYGDVIDRINNLVYSNISDEEVGMQRLLYA